MTTETIQPSTAVATRMGFDSTVGFDLLLRAAKGFSTSPLVPKAYQGPEGIGSCCIALEMANRMGASPLMVMQNLYIVHGNPGWSSKFLIACFNQCGRFTALRYEFTRDADGKASACRAWAIEKATGDRLDGPTVTLAMAKAEGWSTKTGSKWTTMPELMLMYRSAAFMIRVYAPEISMGLQTAEEVIDMGPVEEVERPMSTTLAAIKARADEPMGIDTLAPDEGAALTAFTYAEVREALDKAKTADEFDEAASLIGNVADEAQRGELRAIYERGLPMTNAKA